MTANQLQKIVVRLSNAAWVRHWLHWNYPCRDPWVMAIQVRDHDGNAVHVLPLDARGFEWEEVNMVHFINRKNEDGTPFECSL